MFKPTHTFYFGEKSLNNKAMFPDGVPCVAGPVDEDGYTEWNGEEGNCVGFTQGYEANEFGSYVEENVETYI